MKTRQHIAPQPAHRLGLKLDTACDFAAVREAAQFARSWLTAREIPEAEAGAWELALVEACNNAVEHASSAARKLPVTFEVLLGEKEIEARITDHTTGFELSDQVALPDLDSEGGRGLFVIQSLTDHMVYLRGKGENQLILRKHRSQPTLPDAPEPLALQRRLDETELALAEMTEELAASYESLVAMFHYGAELGNHTDVLEFSRRLLVDLMQLTETDAAVLRLLGEGGRLETFLTVPADLKEQIPEWDRAKAGESVEQHALQSREDLWLGASETLAAADPLRVISGGRTGIVHAFGVGGQMLGTATLIRSRNETPFRSSQVNLLHTFIDFLAIQITNRRLLDERTRSQVTRRELEIAASIQRSLLPLSLPDCPPFELAASCVSAREIGGDFYDVLSVGDEGLLFIIADVMGKGVPAAFFAALLRSAVRSMPDLFQQPAALLMAVNRTLCEDFSRVDMFVTVKAVYLDRRRKTILFASAGHCPLLLWRPGQQAAQVAENAGMPLGIDPACEYAQNEVDFPPGTTALLYTDGVTELQNAAGQMYGDERLRHFLPRLAPAAIAHEMSRRLLDELDGYRAEAPLTDDQTFVLLHHAL